MMSFTPPSEPSFQPPPTPGPPAPNPPSQVTAVTPWEKVIERCRLGALNHYLAALARTVDEFFARRERGRGMDLRVALAILPDGKGIFHVELRPVIVPREVGEELRKELESLDRPPVGGPVAMLIQALVWGGSEDADASFRHRWAPSFRNECPPEFTAALDQAEASQPTERRVSPLSFWERVRAGAVWRGIGRVSRFKPSPPAPLPEGEGSRRPSPRPSPGGSGGPTAKPSPLAPLPKGGGRYGLKAAVKRKALALYRAVVPARPSAHQKTLALPPAERTAEKLSEKIKTAPEGAPAYFWRAMLYQQQQQYAAAIADYTEYIARVPDAPAVYIQRGFCHHASGSRELALADYNEAVRRNPRDANALMHRAMLFADLEGFARAIEDAAAAIQFQPEEPEGYLLRGKMYASLGKLDEGLADLDRALRLDPHHAESRFYRALMRRDPRRGGGPTADESRAAIADLTAALRLNPQHAMSHAYRAEMHVRLGDFAAALADSAAAIRLDRQCAIAFCLRGHANIRLGHRREAIDDCSEAIRLGLDGWLVRLSRAEAHLGEHELEDALADGHRAL